MAEYIAAEWDNLIMNSRGMALNGSFNDRKETPERNRKSGWKGRHTVSPASSEESLLSKEQEEYEVTKYVMEYTDIFEPSQQKLDFVDVQDGDTIYDVSEEETVAHSVERQPYEDIPTMTHGEETRTSKDDGNGETVEDDEDNRLHNGVPQEHEGHGEDDSEEKEVGSVNLSESGTVEESAEVNQTQHQKNGVNLGMDESERRLETRIDKEVEVVEEKQAQVTDEEKQSEDEEVEERVKIEKYDDEEEEKTELDKLLENDNDRQDEKRTSGKEKQRKKTKKSQMVSSATQAGEEEPLLNASISPLPESPESSSESPRGKKSFTAKAYPGKVVKSVAIGTDDLDNHISATQNAFKEVDFVSRRGKATRGTGYNARTNGNEKHGSPSVSKNRRRQNEDGGPVSSSRLGMNRVSEPASHSSDANFFRSRLPQTSKRHPKRHVWLCRDSEIHRLIAEKAAILRRYKEEGVTGRTLSRGFPNYSEVDVLGLPSVGFSGRTKDDSGRKSLPYGRHPSSVNSSGYRSYRGSSSEDEDERTNRLGTKGAKSSGTFAVGLAARRDKTQNKQQHQTDDDEDGCELCAAEAREREKHEKRLKELEEAAKAGPHHPRNLMLGIVYSAKFFGSTNLMSPPTPNKAVRLQQAQEAIGRIKVPEGEEQPSSEVDLFISTERIKVVSSDKKQSLIDHHLKTISFIADIGDIIVVMARLSSDNDVKTWSGKMPSFNNPNQEEKSTKVICHVLETPEAQIVAKTVGQAFSIAYHEFLKVNKLNIGEIEDMEYNGILEQQKILGEELSLLADESKAKEVVIHKKYGESLSMMIVESGWGSMVPTVLIAHLDNKGPAAKSGQLNVGNQILAVNGQSLVGLPLLECQNIIKAMKYEERVAFKIVFCPPTVEISINRPDTKYQLGFSVQNGMICSLMRGGIAERGGIRVGHKIIEMNGESVVAASHHHIVDVLQTTVGELRMKTMPITLYKLLVGLEVPQYI